VGLQWGDEGKGKVVDWLTEEHDIVVRFNGGANAGHTVVVAGETYKLSLVPSGIINPNLACVIANGVVIDPERLLEEIDSLTSRGLKVENRLFISDRAHVIFPYHKEEERLREQFTFGSHGAGLGTTRRGIGPCYAEKANRIHAVRMGDLLRAERLRERLHTVVPFKNQMLRAMDSQATTWDADQLTDRYCRFAQRLRPFITDTFWYLNQAVQQEKNILFEAAQGTLLDLDHGSFPYVTSSNSSSAGLASGCGVNPRRVDRVLGILKAYTTRVGAGPFPTELNNETGEHIRQEGREFGTVTGRARRCGWLDLVAARYSALLNGIDSLAVMLLDVLGKLDQLCICEAYEVDGQPTQQFPIDLDDLARCKPIYRTLPGWKKDLRKCRSAEDLPTEARLYLDTIRELIGVPVEFVSVGPSREQTIRFPCG
jgi:adenylosuccinate synthase